MVSRLAAFLRRHSSYDRQGPGELPVLLRPLTRVGTISLGQIVATGCGHPHAVCIPTRGGLRVIWARRHTDTPYDPARRCRRECRLEAVTLAWEAHSPMFRAAMLYWISDVPE